ncbi:hypothetical protein SCLCIDRAFT_1216332 [Scleroderma citrinum Foug A]|uniref:Ricin B lectin domain-containing protein n=1 Tax=Scleroderma citrinum Foug A TaxID=1036808 RepID=A0A0C3A840_9AGAM|nr:hypothetical protein SCLCIDRAFT_1216332 [Scleroderma citrinum Foug A]
MSPDGCQGFPDNGVYFISVNNQWIGDQKVPGVVNIVVNNRRTPFFLRWLNKNPCTYEISLGPEGGKNFVQRDQQWVNVKGQYQQWVLCKLPGDTYAIALKQDINLVWTDLGPGGPAGRQIQLKSFDSNNAAQRFRISK